MVARKIIAFLAVSLPLCAPASAQTVPWQLHEKHFYGEGICSGQDTIPILQTNWEGVSISIVNAELTFEPSAGVDPSSYIFAGDSTPGADIMVWGQPTDGEAFTAVNQMPAGTAMLLLPPDHVDTHVSCFPAGVGFQVYLTVWYLRVAPVPET